MDFRQLLKFKHALFQGEEAITPSTKMPESVFKQMSSESDLPQIRNHICGCEDQILRQISCDGQVDLNAFFNLVDLFTYFPKKLPKIATGTKSPEIFRIMTSNNREKATAEKDTDDVAASRLKRNLELIWQRIDERF